MTEHLQKSPSSSGHEQVKVEELLSAEKQLLKKGTDLCFTLLGPRKLFCKVLQPERWGPQNPSEVDILLRLKHPYCLCLLALVDANKYFQMPALALLSPHYNTSLTFFLKEKKPSPAQRVALAQRIALTVRDLHHLHILHLDLKMDNIMLNKDEEPILVDFGSARETDTDLLCFVHPEARFVTPEITSPELLVAYTEKEVLTYAWYTDVWQMGLLMLTILTNGLRLYPPHVEHNNLQDIQFYFQETLFQGEFLYTRIMTLLKKAQWAPKQALLWAPIVLGALNPEPEKRPAMASLCLSFPQKLNHCRKEEISFAQSSLSAPQSYLSPQLSKAAQDVIGFYAKHCSFVPVRTLFMSVDLFYAQAHLWEGVKELGDFLRHLAAVVSWLALKTIYGVVASDFEHLLLHFQISNKKKLLDLLHRVLLQSQGLFSLPGSYAACKNKEEAVYFLNHVLPFAHVYAHWVQSQAAHESFFHVKSRDILEKQSRKDFSQLYAQKSPRDALSAQDAFCTRAGNKEKMTRYLVADFYRL